MFATEVNHLPVVQMLVNGSFRIDSHSADGILCNMGAGAMFGVTFSVVVHVVIGIIVESGKRRKGAAEREPLLIECIASHARHGQPLADARGWNDYPQNLSHTFPLAV